MAGRQAQGGDHRRQARRSSKCWTPRPASSCSREDPGAQNIFTFNDETGVKTLLPPGPPDGIRRCPSNNGARNFLAGSYDPNTNRYYLSINDICTGKAGDTPDRMVGLDLDTREFTMDIKSRVMQSSAKLTTAGGLLFSAAADRYFRAYDERDGKVLWQMRAPGRAERVPDHLHGGRQAVHRDDRRQSRAHRQRRRSAPRPSTCGPRPPSVLWVWQLP